jgi:hypothetical protein
LLWLRAEDPYIAVEREIGGQHEPRRRRAINARLSKEAAFAKAQEMLKA